MMLASRCARISAACAFAAGLQACSPTLKQSDDGQRFETTAMVAENSGWLDVVVFLVHGSTRTRLGTVSSLRTARFNIPRAHTIGASTVTLELAPVGSAQSYFSPAIAISPGHTLVLRIGNALTLSTFAVYRDGIP